MVTGAVRRHFEKVGSSRQPGRHWPGDALDGGDAVAGVGHRNAPGRTRNEVEVRAPGARAPDPWGSRGRSPSSASLWPRGVCWLVVLSPRQASLGAPPKHLSGHRPKQRPPGRRTYALRLLGRWPHGRQERRGLTRSSTMAALSRAARFRPTLTPPGPEFVDPRRSHGPYNTRNGTGKPGNGLLVRSRGVWSGLNAVSPVREIRYCPAPVRASRKVVRPRRFRS